MDDQYSPDNNPFDKFAPANARPLSDAQWSAVTTFLTRASFGQAEFKLEKTEKGQITFGTWITGYIYRITDTKFYWYLFEDTKPDEGFTGGGSLENVARDMLQKMFHLHVQKRAEKHHGFAPEFLL